MDRAYVRLPADLGKVVEVSAIEATKRHFNLLPYICPECAEALTLVANVRGHFNNPFFRHPRKQDCMIKECTERVNITPGMASAPNRQRPYIPLFLYRKADGKYALAVALTAKMKAELAKKQYSRFLTYQIRCGNDIKANVSMKRLLSTPKTEFVDLQHPIPKKAQFVPHLGKVKGEHKPLNEAMGLPVKMLDCFMAASCTGAMFRVVTDGVYEKLPAGSFIAAGQKYVIIDKVTNLSKTVNNNFGNYAVEMKQLGVLSLESTKTRYTVCEITFGRCKTTPHYADMVKYITEKYGVILCDDAVPYPVYEDIYTLDGDTTLFQPEMPPQFKPFVKSKVKPKKEPLLEHENKKLEHCASTVLPLAAKYGTAKYEQKYDKYNKY